MAEEQPDKRRIDLSILGEAPRIIKSQLDVALNRNVAATVMSWCYPWTKEVTIEMSALTLGIQAGFISTLLDNIERLLAEKAILELSIETQRLQL